MGDFWWRLHEVMTPQRWADVGTLAFMVYLIVTWEERAARNRQAKADREENKAVLEAKLKSEYDEQGHDRPFPFRR